MADTLATVRQHADTGNSGLLDQLNATTTDSRGSSLTAVGHRAAAAGAIRDLEARKERLEAELSAQSAEFRAQTQSVTLEAVQAALPETRRCSSSPCSAPSIRGRAQRRRLRAAALRRVRVRRHVRPRGSISDRRSRSSKRHALRKALRDPRGADVGARGPRVDALVMRAAAPAWRRRGSLISPDGDLNLVPFEALVDEARPAISYGGTR